MTGRFQLPADEFYQYGFKLAARAANRTIYPIDTFGPTLLNNDTRIDEYPKAHFTSVSDPTNDAYEARGNRLERDGTFLDLLRYLNSDAAIRANASRYSVFDGMGRDSHDAGSAYVSNGTHETAISSRTFSASSVRVTESSLSRGKATSISHASSFV